MESYPAVGLVGSRECGGPWKTTLLVSLMRNLRPRKEQLSKDTYLFNYQEEFIEQLCPRGGVLGFE